MFWSREKKKEDDENKENYSPSGSKNVDASSWDLQKFLDTEIDIMGYKASYGVLIMGFLALVSIIGFVMVYTEPQEEMEYIEMAAPVASFAPAVPSFAPPAMVPSPFVPPPMMMAPAHPKKRSGKKKSGKKSAKKSAKKKSAKRR